MTTYRDAGVDLDAAGSLIGKIAALARSTFRPEVLTDIGGFAGQFRVPGGYREPVLVASTDGVGTKVKIAQSMGIHHTVGIDLVAMCVNDIVVQGADPLFFLDYLAAGRLELGVVEKLVQGIVAGCKQAGCALLGGETAEMPGLYREGEYDLAGFVVGILERDRSIDGRLIRKGDAVIGIPSSGLHSNGYSLVRKVLETAVLPLEKVMPELGRSLGEELLEPTRIYCSLFGALTARWQIRGAVHVTGGGLIENIPRILPQGVGVSLDPKRWKIPPVFDLLKEKGDVPVQEMFRTFNMGIGLVVILPGEDAVEVLKWLQNQGEGAFLVGEVIELPDSDPCRVQIVGVT